MARLLPSKCSVAVTLGDLKVTDRIKKVRVFANQTVSSCKVFRYPGITVRSKTMSPHPRPT